MVSTDSCPSRSVMTERSTPSCNRSRAIVCLNTGTVPPHQNSYRTSQNRPHIEAGRDWPDKSPSFYPRQVKLTYETRDRIVNVESGEVPKNELLFTKAIPVEKQGRPRCGQRERPRYTETKRGTSPVLFYLIWGRGRTTTTGSGVCRQLVILLRRGELSALVVVYRPAREAN